MFKDVFGSNSNPYVGSRLFHITPYNVQVRGLRYSPLQLVAYGSLVLLSLLLQCPWHISLPGGLLSPFSGYLCSSTVSPPSVDSSPVFAVFGVNYEVCTNELDGHPCGSSFCG